MQIHIQCIYPAPSQMSDCYPLAWGADLSYWGASFSCFSCACLSVFVLLASFYSRCHLFYEQNVKVCWFLREILSAFIYSAGLHARDHQGCIFAEVSRCKNNGQDTDPGTSDIATICVFLFASNYSHKRCENGRVGSSGFQLSRLEREFPAIMLRRLCLAHARPAKARQKTASARWRPGIRKRRSAVLTLSLSIPVRTSNGNPFSIACRTHFTM